MNKMINFSLFKKILYKCFSHNIVSKKILSIKPVLTLIIMRNVSWGAIRVISEGLCDTETSLCKNQQIYKRF